MKQLCLILSLLLLLACLTACAGSSAPTETTAVTEAPTEAQAEPQVKGELFQTGILSILQPEGWMAFPATDFDGVKDPYALFLYKDATSDLDMFSHAGLTIRYFPADYVSTPDQNDSAEDLTPFTLNGHEWSGYRYSSMDFPYTVLETPFGERGTLSITMLEKNGEYEISLTDPAVQAILASIELQ